MGDYFDNIAAVYDHVFTETYAGRLQRAVVHKYLDGSLSGSGLRILELNCGTGEDAAFLANLGHKVFATDASSEMIKVAEEKFAGRHFSHKIQLHRLAIQEIDQIKGNEPFDLVFSNFGGLNCLNARELKKLNNDLKNLLIPGGRFAGIIMPLFCLWEACYFLSKFSFKKAFRRLNPKGLKFGGLNAIIVYYYSPGRFAGIFDNFKIRNLIPVGFFLPPAYLEGWLKKDHERANRLAKMESRITNNQFLAGLSDHFLIDLEMNK